MHIVESKHGKLSAEELAALVILADAAEDAEERRVVAEEASMPLLSVERIEDGWLVTAKDDDGKPYRTAFTDRNGFEKRPFEELMWFVKEQLCPDLDGEEMRLAFKKKE